MWYVVVITSTDYDTPCKFPYINKGFNTDNITSNDCSITYSEALGDSTVINGTYFVLAIIFVGLYYRHLVVTFRKKQKRKMSVYTIVDKLLLSMIFFSATVAVNCLDMDGAGNILPWIVHTEMQSLGIFCPITVMKLLMMEWVTIITAQGGKKRTPMWVYVFFWITSIIQFVAMCVVCPIEFLISDTEGDLWAFDGTLNAIKNLTTATDLIIWSFMAIRYGMMIQKVLGSGSGEKTLSKEQVSGDKKVRSSVQNCYKNGYIQPTQRIFARSLLSCFVKNAPRFARRRKKFAFSAGSLHCGSSSRPAINFWPL